MKLRSFLTLIAPAAMLTAVLFASGCGPKAVRGDDVEGLDDEAMSTGLDRRDLQKMLHENMAALQSSAGVRRWEQEDRPAVAVLSFRNDTSEHIDSALDALISDVETQLINAGHVRVVSVERQSQLMQEIRTQQTDSFNPAQVAEWGQQIGARYFITGKVFSTDERMKGERRVQYFMFMQVLAVETGEILFQNKTSVTKAIL